MKLALLCALTAVSAFASYSKLVCTTEDQHESYESIEVDREKKGAALVHKEGGVSLLKYKKQLLIRRLVQN